MALPQLVTTTARLRALGDVEAGEASARVERRGVTAPAVERDGVEPDEARVFGREVGAAVGREREVADRAVEARVSARAFALGAMGQAAQARRSSA